MRAPKPHGRKFRPGEEEHWHQCRVVAELRRCGLLFASSLNGIRLTPRLRAKAKAEGMERGEPDLRIYDPPPAMPGKVGIMVEMKVPSKQPKTSRAMRWSGAEKHQRERMARLEAVGWYCVVGYGARDALDKIRAAGYPVEGGE